MEASLQPNPHILYGGVWASPLRDDGMIASRKDYTCTSRRGNFSVPFIFWGSGEGGGAKEGGRGLAACLGGKPKGCQQAPFCDASLPACRITAANLPKSEARRLTDFCPGNVAQMPSPPTPPTRRSWVRWRTWWSTLACRGRTMRTCRR